MIALAALFAAPRGAMALPADDIRSAVLAGGATSVKAASQKQFSAALAAVMAGKTCRKVREYAFAAAKLRPDFARIIVNVAIAAVTLPGRKPDDDCVASIAAAIVGAEPSLANQIAAWAAADDPAAAGAIAVAINALPGGPAVSVSNRGGNAGFFAPSGVSAINPSNVTGGSTSPTGP